MATLKKTITRLLAPSRGEHAPDKPLIAAVLAILAFGLVALSSAGTAISFVRFGNPYFYFWRQLVWAVIGLAVFYAASRIDYRLWKNFAFGFLAFSFVLLLLVFVPGIAESHDRTRSWISVFGFSVQPAEFVKLSFLLYLAAWLEARKGQLGKANAGIGPFVVILCLVGGLMLLQPDIGTLSIIAAVSLAVYFVGGGKLRHILAIILVGLLGMSAMVSAREYQKNRFRCLLDPSFDTQRVCYQTNQSLIAVGSGGWFGRGLGESRQKFMYLPEAVQDSIFAVIAEETGLVVSVALVLAYLFLFYRGFLVARAAPDDFGRILAIGIVSWITIQAMINIGGIINLMPMTGVPLPLVSHGGSSIVAALAAIGILVNISKQTRMR